MRVGITEFTTLRASFEEDLAAYGAAGVQGIGVCELKLPADAASLLRSSGLRVTACVPAVPSILPLPPMEGPSSPRERIEAICASVRRLAELRPQCVLFLTGPGEEQRDVVVDGVCRIAAVGEEVGVRVALEPVHPSQAEAFSFVNSIPEAVSLLEDADTLSVGLLVDLWHLGDDPELPEHVLGHAERIFGVHVADRREPTRSLFDRVLPGDGILPLRPLLRALDEAGYEGFYDVEIFSDDGTFGDAFPDSLWAEEPSGVARRARESLERLWAER